jgi:cell division protease FtsH
MMKLKNNFNSTWWAKVLHGLPLKKIKCYFSFCIISSIITTLAGRVTEQVVFGNPEVTTGASNDLQQVTNIARKWLLVMVCQTLDQLHLKVIIMSKCLGGEYNEAIADRIDTEVCKIINHCEQIATEIVLDRVVIDFSAAKIIRCRNT